MLCKFIIALSAFPNSQAQTVICWKKKATHTIIYKLIQNELPGGGGGAPCEHQSFMLPRWEHFKHDISLATRRSIQLTDVRPGSWKTLITFCL